MSEPADRAARDGGGSARRDPAIMPDPGQVGGPGAILVVALLLLNFPLLTLIEAWRAEGHEFATVLYLFGAWGVLIAAAAWAIERRRPD